MILLTTPYRPVRLPEKMNFVGGGVALGRDSSNRRLLTYEHTSADVIRLVG